MWMAGLTTPRASFSARACAQPLRQAWRDGRAQLRRPAMMLSHMGRGFACLLAQSERRRYDRFSLLRKTDAVRLTSG
jgi:hypothetical protein